ncbi:hypothetical protein AGMMS50267_06140 [Spirochaetia bacterium]|nr:hypothetical protein AGMMS50267_06140 [Spirochaetia bacterium]
MNQKKTETRADLKKSIVEFKTEAQTLLDKIGLDLHGGNPDYEAAAKDLERYYRLRTCELRNDEFRNDESSLDMFFFFDFISSGILEDDLLELVNAAGYKIERDGENLIASKRMVEDEASQLKAKKSHARLSTEKRNAKCVVNSKKEGTRE